MARSQLGPFAAAPFVALPTCRHSKFDPQVFRVLLRRRLRLPLPLRCLRLHDPLGHHRAGCSEAGVLGKRGFPLEKAAEQVCCEVGPRVSTNVYVRDWTWRNTTCWTIGGWRWWQTASLCGIFPSTDTTLVSAQRWQSTPPGGHPQRSCPSARSQEEDHHTPGAHRRGRTSTAGGVGGGSGRTFLRRTSILCTRLDKSKVPWPASDPARSCQSTPLRTAGRHPRVHGG